MRGSVPVLRASAGRRHPELPQYGSSSRDLSLEYVIKPQARDWRAIGDELACSELRRGPSVAPARCVCVRMVLLIALIYNTPVYCYALYFASVTRINSVHSEAQT